MVVERLGPEPTGQLSRLGTELSLMGGILDAHAGKLGQRRLRKGLDGMDLTPVQMGQVVGEPQSLEEGAQVHGLHVVRPRGVREGRRQRGHRVRHPVVGGEVVAGRRAWHWTRQVSRWRRWKPLSKTTEKNSKYCYRSTPERAMPKNMYMRAQDIPEVATNHKKHDQSDSDLCQFWGAAKKIKKISHAVNLPKGDKNGRNFKKNIILTLGC